MNSSTRSKGRQKAGIDAAFNGGGIGAFMDHGETAMWSTIFAGAIGGLAGYVSHREQYPKITHSWTTEQRNYWGGKAPKGSDGYSMELHHPYGRNGRGYYIYYPMERTAHQQLTIYEASIYGKGIHPMAPYTNWWEI